MHSVVIFSGNPEREKDETLSKSKGYFSLGGYSIGCALLETSSPEFDTSDPKNDDAVLIQKIAFSCNYRDRSLLLNFVINANKYATENSDDFLYACIGSDFVAKVLAIGKNVNHLATDDLVIPNAAYPYIANSTAMPGIPTNEASARLQILHNQKLVKIPKNMSIQDAASFTIGAQTAYSIVRNAKINDNKRILVTSGRSNTSLFVLNAIKDKTNLYVLSSSKSDRRKFEDMGVNNLIDVDYAKTNLIENTGDMQAILRACGGFDVIIDPFIDTHLKFLVSFLNFDSIYITCGLYNQFFLPNEIFSVTDQMRIFSTLIQLNASIKGNCLGYSDDLLAALKDYESGEYNTIIDSIHTGHNVSSFFDRTYNSENRWGRVVYIYED